MNKLHNYSKLGWANCYTALLDAKKYLNSLNWQIERVFKGGQSRLGSDFDQWLVELVWTLPRSNSGFWQQLAEISPVKWLSWW